MNPYFTPRVYHEVVPQVLARLRSDLDFMPSPLPERPGLLIRDPFQYSPSTLIIPPVLVSCLRCFDGRQSPLDLRAHLTELTGELRVSDIADHLERSLDEAGFLENERLSEMRDARHREFAASPERGPAHAGSAYPDEEEELRGLLDQYMEAAPGPADGPCGIAAPHVSPDGGWQCYRDAFSALPAGYRDRTFVVLGTSHYGQPERFGLTRKPFVTPFGATTPALDLIGRLESAAPGAVVMEDYCHAVEHSIEFQIIFLQSLFGADVRVLPVLCGSFARSLYEGGLPEDDGQVHRFFDALASLQDREGDRLCWVLGIDMAHIGRRYGDGFTARAHQDGLLEIGGRDRARIDAVNAGDSSQFWSLVQENHDDLKWCGSAPLYTFLKAAPKARGRLRRYDQWNIDDESVVSFAALEFASA